jgi:hypothetical protein
MPAQVPKGARAATRSGVSAALVLLALLAGVVISACGSTASGRITAARALRVARWSSFVVVRRPLDVAGPLRDGSLVLAANKRLWLLSGAGGVKAFASGPGGYRSPGGEEPYIAVSPGSSFGSGTVYALRLTGGRGVVAISASGHVRRFANLTLPGLIDGVTFDTTGRFGRRLLVTINAGSVTAVQAIDPHGAVGTITRNAPRVEGGIAVAPSTFGRFAGDLIAPSETTGQIFAISPSGVSSLLANSGLPHGGDVGVESEAFVPRDPRADAFVADRVTPGSPHPGDDEVLRIRASALRNAGVHPGDLLVSTEGGALVDDVSPVAGGYRVRLVARGPAVAHGEGHIAFARSR